MTPYELNTQRIINRNNQLNKEWEKSMKPTNKESKNDAKHVEFDEKRQKYMDLRHLLETDELLTYSSYLSLETQTVVVTIYTFDIPLKQVKIDLSESPFEIIEKEES